MESTNDNGQSPNVSNNQQVLNDILNLTIGANYLGERVKLILDYLFTVPGLHLLPSAAVFLVDHTSRKLILTQHRGFSESQQKHCSEVPFGMCHCGEAAQLGKIHLSHCDYVSSSQNCTQTGQYAHVCVPVVRNSLLVAIACFYVTGDLLHPGDLELLNSICHIIGGILETEEMDTQLINLVNDLSVTIANLRNEKKFSESVIQGLDHGLLVVDLHGNILKSNAVAATILKPFARTLEGKNLVAIVGPQAAEQMMRTCANPSMPPNNELTLTTSTGDNRVISYTTVTRDDAKGRQVGLIISLTDISEIKYVRKEMEKMNRLATVAEIAAAVAHEVRNPLAGIKIMAQSIEEQTVTVEEQKECSRRIVRQVDRLNELLTDFFSYARPVTPKIKPIQVVDILSDTRHLVDNKLVSKNITFANEHQPNLPLVMADPNQLQQVFLNLFLNAIDAVQQGGSIKVVTEQLDVPALLHYKRKHPGLLAESRYLRLCFSDNGLGMSPATADNAFEPFFTTKTTGSGLGLSIVYRTLKDNGAAIIVDSAEGRGTTFTIFFRIPE